MHTYSAGVTSSPDITLEHEECWRDCSFSAPLPVGRATPLVAGVPEEVYSLQQRSTHLVDSPPSLHSMGCQPRHCLRQMGDQL